MRCSFFSALERDGGFGDRTSAPLGDRRRRPSEAEAIIIRKWPGPRAQPRGAMHRALHPSLLRSGPHPQPLSTGEGSRAGVARLATRPSPTLILILFLFLALEFF